jgi:hypothetical protein
MGMEYHVYSDEEKRLFRENPGELLRLRKATEKSMSSAFPLLIKGSKTQKAAETYMKEQMEKKLNNPELAKKLIPNFTVGCRRLTVSL